MHIKMSATKYRRLVYTLIHWGRVTHLCVDYLTIIGSDNGLSPGRRQAIIWINAGILLIGPLGINFREMLIEIKTFPFKKMRLKVSSAKRWPFCFGINVLICYINLVSNDRSSNVHCTQCFVQYNATWRTIIYDHIFIHATVWYVNSYWNNFLSYQQLQVSMARSL